MHWWTTILIDAALAAAAAAAVVVGPELAAGAAVLKTARAIEFGYQMAATAATAGVIGVTTATAVGMVHDQEAADFDPFGSPPGKKPRPDHFPEIKNNQQTDAKVPEKDGQSETEVEYERPEIPIVSPAKSGDYAGIQKTMYNPVTGDVLGMKMVARADRGYFKGSVKQVMSALRRSKVRVHNVKIVAHSPVSVLGFPSS